MNLTKDKLQEIVDTASNKVITHSFSLEDSLERLKEFSVDAKGEVISEGRKLAYLQSESRLYTNKIVFELLSELLISDNEQNW